MSDDVSVLPGGLESLATPLDKLTPHPRNARRSALDPITASLVANGVYKPIIYQQTTGHILAGNHTYAAAVRAGLESFPAIAVDVDDARALRILAADNRIPEAGGYDDRALAALLEEITTDGSDLTGTGYDDADLDDLLASLDGESDGQELPVGPTDASWSEEPDAAAERAQRVSSTETLAAQGLSEILLVLPVDTKTALLADISALREHLGDDTPTGAAIAHACRIALVVMDAAHTGSPPADWDAITAAASERRP